MCLGRVCLPLCGQIVHCSKILSHIFGENGPAHPPLPTTQAAGSI